MIATIAVIAAITEKKIISVIAAIIRKPLSSYRSGNDLWDIKSSISVIVFTAITGKWFPYDRCNR